MNYFYVAVQPDHLRGATVNDNSAVFNILQRLQSFGGCELYPRFNNTVRAVYKLDRYCAALMTRAEWDALIAEIANGLIIANAFFYMEIPIALLDAPVPASLPKAVVRKQTSENPEEWDEEHNRTWREYFPVVKENETHALVRIAHGDWSEQNGGMRTRTMLDVQIKAKPLAGHGPDQYYGVAWNYISQAFAYANNQGYSMLCESEKDAWE